ncbi:MAG TPA: hypothetical protein VMC85_09600 [Desulfomonilaceae bacterium]|nr:hypothetical protein [Desulfomonilaceae bacterium]
MAKKRLLNPLLKVALCSMGVAAMAYLLIPPAVSGGPYDYLTMARASVLLGFVYFLIQSLRQVLRGPKD